MNELEQLKALIADAQTRIAKLEDAEKAAVWPKKGDLYWYVSGEGLLGQWYWDNGNDDKRRLFIGNVFRTQQEAEKELNARKVVAELRRCEGARKFVVGECNYSVGINLEIDEVYADYWLIDTNGFGNAYFETHDQAQAAIQTVGAERILAAAKWLAMGE